MYFWANFPGREHEHRGYWVPVGRFTAYSHLKENPGGGWGVRYSSGDMQDDFRWIYTHTHTYVYWVAQKFVCVFP